MMGGSLSKFLFFFSICWWTAAEQMKKKVLPVSCSCIYCGVYMVQYISFFSRTQARENPVSNKISVPYAKCFLMIEEQAAVYRENIGLPINHLVYSGNGLSSFLSWNIWKMNILLLELRLLAMMFVIMLLIYQMSCKFLVWQCFLLLLKSSLCGGFMIAVISHRVGGSWELCPSTAWNPSSTCHSVWKSKSIPTCCFQISKNYMGIHIQT